MSEIIQTVNETFTAPWCDCKVAFDVDCDDDQVWEAFLPPKSRYKLPTGWSLSETDGSGSRLMVLFRVEGVPLRTEDGEAVALILRDVEKDDE
jgi:hypothetical protein